MLKRKPALFNLLLLGQPWQAIADGATRDMVGAAKACLAKILQKA